MVAEFDAIPTIIGILVIVIPAILIGKLFSKLGISEIIGFVIGGMLFGQHAIGGIIQFNESPLVEMNPLMLSFWEISGIIILFSAGLHFTFRDLRKAGFRAAFVGIGGVILPLVLGYAVGVAFGFAWTASILIGTALSATSIAVSVTILEELGKTKTKEGNLLVNAAVLDDVLGLALLSAMTSVVFTKDVASIESVVFATVESIGFWILLLLAAVFFLPKIVHLAATAHPATLESRGTNQGVALGSAFGTAAIAGSIGLNPIVGAFAAGMGLADSKFATQVREFVGRLKIMFAPLFFALIGAHVDLAKIFDVDVLLFISLVVMAIVSKIVGSGVPAMMFMRYRKTGMRVGYGMIARGEIAFVTAGLGLSYAIIDHAVFSTLVLVILATIFVSPVLFRLSFNKKNSKTGK